MNLLQLVFWKLCVLTLGPVWAGPLKARFVRQTVQISDEELLIREICQIGDGEYRHPFSCNKFLQCGAGGFTEKECPFNMMYDIKIKACNFARKMKCQVIDGFSDFGDSITTPGPAQYHQAPEQAQHKTQPQEQHEQSEQQEQPETATVLLLPETSKIATTETFTSTATSQKTKKVPKKAQALVALPEVKQNVTVPVVLATITSQTVPSTQRKSTAEMIHYMQPSKEEADCVIWEDE